MKRLILVCILALQTLQSNLAASSLDPVAPRDAKHRLEGSQEDLFAQANELYKKNNYTQAQDLYEKIADKNSRVYYNLGNCFYKQQKYGQALLNWRKAEHDWGIFNRSELLQNIALVKKTGAHPAVSGQTGARPEGSKDRSAQTESNPVQKLVVSIKNLTASILSFIRSVPLLFLQIIFLGIWFVLFGLLRFLYHNKQRILITILFLLLITTGSVLALKYGLNSRSYAIVLTNTSLLSGPGDAYQVLGSITETEEVIIQKKSGDYCKINIDGKIGWVACKNIGII